MPTPVLDALREHIDLEARIGGYAAADRRSERLAELYPLIASLINAAPEEVAITESATVAWQRAFYALPLQNGDRILTAEAEYAANFVAYLQVKKRYGVEIDIVPNNQYGELDVDALQDMLDERVKLISITWVPTNGGLVNPAEEVGKIARSNGILYLLDACQAVGQMPVDVETLGCDILSATGRKFLRGPRGTGFLYVRRDLMLGLEPAMIDHFAAPWTSTDSYELRGDARRFETWENNYTARLGLAAAVEYALGLGLHNIETRCLDLSRTLREALRSVPGVTIRDLGRTPSSIVSFTLDGVPAESVVAEAARRSITVGTSTPASTRLDAEARELPPIVRASPHYFNTDEEVGKIVDVVAEMG